MYISQKAFNWQPHMSNQKHRKHVVASNVNFETKFVAKL